MRLSFEIGQCSDTGPRDRNEDVVASWVDPSGSRGVVAAVADGVSRGGLGAEAARTTVSALLSDFFATPPTWETTVVFDRLIAAQNIWLADHNRRRANPERGTALTTLTALALRGQTWTVAHVGDSRAWLWREESGRSEAAEAAGAAVGAGGAAASRRAVPTLSLITNDHAFDSPGLRSQLTRAIGLDDGVRVDYFQGEARVGDRYVLTSDGVHGVLKPDTLSQLASAGSAQAAADALVRGARAAGSTDNASALVLWVTGLDDRDLADELADARRLDGLVRLRVGDQIDGYVVTAKVADNGVHQLFQARSGTDGALVALKCLHPSRAGDAEERAMLAHEAWLGLRVSGAADGGAFVRVHPRHPGAQRLYTVFDWHPGRTMGQRAPGAPLPSVERAVAAGLTACRALGQLHRLGVVHRDIKPDNLHLGDDGRWRILDLGSAISGRESAEQRALHAGTPSYMNPEQWQDQGADSGSDLYALGVTLYQFLTGRLPYGEVEPYQLARYRRDPVPVSRLRPDVPIWLSHVLMRAVARDPRQRFETAEEFGLALQRGAARPLDAPRATPLIRRDSLALLKAGLVVSLLFNLLLVVWLLFLPR